MDFPDEEIEAEIQAELDKLNVEDLDLNSSAADSSEDDGITRVTEDVFTEQSSSDSEKKNNGDVQNSTLEVVNGDQDEFWSTVNEVANQLRADLEDCNKLLEDADLRIDSLRKVEFSQEMKDIAHQEGKSAGDLKSEILRDVEKLEEDLERELSKEKEGESSKLNAPGDGSVGYFEANTMVLVPSKKFPRSARLTTANTVSTPSTVRPDSNLSTGRLTSLAVEWDQYVTEIEADMDGEIDLDPATIEKEAMLRLVQLHKSQKANEKERAERLMKYKARMKELSQKHERRMEEKKKLLAEEEAGLEKAKLSLLETVQVEEKEMQESILQLENQHQEYMQKKIAALLEEQEQLQKQKGLLEQEIDKKRNWAATKIQKCYRGSLARRKYRLLVKLRHKRMEEWKAMRDADAIAEIAHKNREAKMKTEEEKRAKEAALAKKAEKNRRENEEAKKKIQAAEKEKREKIKEEKLKKLTGLNEKEKVELESQESEIIEKLRSDEKTAAEKKADKLINEKKQKKLAKKEKSKNGNGNSEVNGSSSFIDDEVTASIDASTVQEESTSDLQQLSKRAGKPNENSKHHVTFKEQILENDDEENPKNAKTRSEKGHLDYTNEAGKSSANDGVGKLSREGTVKIDFIDMNKELNNLIQFPCIEKPKPEDAETPQNISTGDNANAAPQQVKPLDESLFTLKDNDSNLESNLANENDVQDYQESRDSDKTFIVSEHESILDQQKSHDSSNMIVQDLIDEDENDSVRRKEKAVSFVDDWPNQDSNNSKNANQMNGPAVNHISPSIDQNETTAVYREKQDETGEAHDSFETGEETEQFIDAVAEANLSVDVDVASVNHQTGLQSIQENASEEPILTEVPKNSDSFETYKLDAVLEKRRIQWMSDCIPWSKIKSVQKQSQAGAKPRLPIRSAASKRLAKIPENVILSGSVGQMIALKNVQTVVLEDLPGYNLEPLGECPNLEYLVLDSCNILSLEGISNCAKLKLVHARHNKLEGLNLGNLEELVELDVSSNRISSLAGLDGCPNLRILNLMDNKVSRFGSLIGLKKLQRLNISMNQLISTRGLSLISTLTLLDVSSNNITSLDEMESLALLQCLNASHNSLQEMPKFTNNVLLRHLDLSHNNLSSVAVFSLCWLPLLKTLNISYNNIDSLPVLKACVNLEIFDCSTNKVSSIEELVDCLASLMTLRVLQCEENPCLSLPQARNRVLESLPNLVVFNSDQFDPPRNTLKTLSEYHKMCQSQNDSLEALEGAVKLCKSHFLSQNKNNHLSFIATKTALLDKHYELSVKLREEHEFGETTNASEEPMNANSLVESHTIIVEVLTRSPTQTELTRPASSRKEKRGNSNDGRCKTPRAISPVGPLKTVEFVREAWKSAVKDSADVSATKIQALWKGYCVRKKLSAIQAQVEEEINQMLMDEDLQLDDNFNVDDFLNSQNDILLDDWKIGDEELQEPVRNIATPRHAFGSSTLPTVLETERENKAISQQQSPLKQGKISQEWASINHRTPADEVLLPNDWGYSDIQEVESLHLSASASQFEEDKNSNSFSARQAKIAEDWGFKNDATAQLMLKRAKKMSKTKKFIVTDIPIEKRLSTKTSPCYPSGATKSTISGSSKRSSLVGVGGGGGDHSHRYNERNSTVLQAKLFEAVDMKSLDQGDREGYSRVFAWMSKNSSDENQQLTSERPYSGGRSGDTMLRTGPPKQLDQKVSTSRRNSGNISSKDADLDIMSVSDVRSLKSDRNIERSRSQRSYESLSSTASGNMAGFLNKTKVLPPINGKYVDPEGNNSASWGTGKKVTGKPPKVRRTPKM